MKQSISIALLIGALSSPVMAVDLLGGLNKAVNKANEVNTQAQSVATQAQAVEQQVSSPEALLNQALSNYLKPGVSTQEQVVQFLGEPVSSATEGQTQTLQYKANGIVEKIMTAQAVASAFGVQTPDIDGLLNMVFQNGVLQSYGLSGE